MRLPPAVTLSFLAAVAAPVTGVAATAAAERPKLVLLVAVDQFRYDYLTRFRADFRGGLDRLLREGANFTNAHLQHYPTVTAIGHSTMLSGAPPTLSGIVGNDWYDRETRRTVESITDSAVKPVGPAGAAGGGETGASPRRLLVSTLADELKLAGVPSKAIGLSLKDRSAILTVGRMADGAYWLDTKAGAFVTSTWYRSEQPPWLQKWAARRLIDTFAGREWVGGKLPATPGPELYAAVYGSPFGSELLLSLAEAALEGEALGSGEGTDVMSVSFSSNDAVGHAKGPQSPEVGAITRETDRILGQLLHAVDRKVGLDRVLIALTADHGVSPVPELLQARKMPGGRYERARLVDAVSKALVEAFGPGEWIEGRAGSGLYLNHALAREKKIDLEELAQRAASAASEQPAVYRAMTRGQILRGAVPDDPWCRRVARGFHPQRSGDVEILLYPYWLGSGGSGTSHGTPYSYDSHVPLVLRGPGIRPGRYHAAAALNDLAPTLATLLEVETPSGSSGRVLVEALVP